jgi:hypothetical protein
MILGVHNMVDAISHYAKEHLTLDGSEWILGLDGILLIPVIFAVFFFPMVVLIGVSAAVVLAVAYFGLLRIAQKYGQHPGR